MSRFLPDSPRSALFSLTGIPRANINLWPIVSFLKTGISSLTASLQFAFLSKTKARLVKALVFPVVMYGCESWAIKKVEHWRIDAFELWCWRRLLRVPWTARRSNQSILKEINPEYSFGGLMLKLKLQYFGHLIWRTDSLEKILMLGKIKDRKRRGWERMRRLDGIRDSIDMSLSKLWETVKDREAWRVTVHGVPNSQICLSDWTDWPRIVNNLFTTSDSIQLPCSG